VSELLDALAALTPEEIEALQPKDRAWVEASLRREIALRSPADFAVAHSNGAWQPYRHNVYTSEAIRSMVEDDDCDLLIIDQTVRHGKSLLCSRWTPAWFLAKYPNKRVLVASYEGDFAATHGRWVREQINEIGGEYGIAVDDTSRAAARWDLAPPLLGGMGTAGANGAITGKGGHLLIVDDPIKNHEEANSPVMREKTWDWWQSTWVTRREPGVKFLVIMSRWHEDDLIGRLLKAELGMRIKRLRMPAIAEEDDILGRRPGEALCPERYDEEALAGIRKDVGPGPWASLYQQRPVPAGGGMFKRDWFQRWTSITVGDETYYQLAEGALVRAADCWTFSTMDTAYAKSKRSDYTAIATWAVTPTDPTNLLLVDMRRVRVEHFEHAPMALDVWRTHKPSWIGVEKITATLSLFADLQRQGVVVRWLTPDKHKIARAETAAALIAAGRMFFPMDAPWMADYLDEMLTFPVGAHDDMVDVTAYAANELAKRTVNGRTPKRHASSPDDQVWEKLRKRQAKSKHHPILGAIP
jgi:predicted phage terminase large subunit-like protein